MIRPEIATWLSNPETPLELPHEIQLVDFEDEVADLILPEMDEEDQINWLSRTALQDLLRPPRSSFGTIQGIAITALDSPFERLQDAKERGLRFSKDGGIPHSSKYKGKATEHTRAFKFSLATTNGMNRTPGNIETEAWYMPRESLGRGSDGFDPITRFVAIPNLFIVGVDGSKLVVPATNNYTGLSPHRYGMPYSKQGASRRVPEH